MARLTAGKHIDAPADVVFDLMTDLDQADSRISSIVHIEKLTDGPVGVGTRFRETRLMLGKEDTEEMVFTAFNPGKSFTIECDSCGTHHAVHHDLAAVDGGTQITVTFEMKPMSIMAKIMSPMGKLMTKSLLDAFDKDLEEIKALAEGRSTSSSSA
jgi:carbon monoxide dehydrogenase subunit G